MKHVLPAVALAAALAGCAQFGEQPTDTQTGGMSWYRDMPDYHMQSVQWNWIHGENAAQRLANLCAGGQKNYLNDACAFRIKEGGQCVVFSLYSRTAAKLARTTNEDSLYKHELRHCGEGMPEQGGWRHREPVVIR